MTLDGHIKSGLAATIFLSAFIPNQLEGISSLLLAVTLISFAWGNVAPDLLEVRSINLIEHRTYTHYPLFYIVGLLGALATLNEVGINHEWSIITMSFIGYCSGSLMHIICDIPYGKIPYFKVKRGITIMRVPFDSFLNKIIEHSVLIIFLLGYLYLSIDANTLNNIFTPGELDISSF